MKQGGLQPRGSVSLRDVPGLSFSRLDDDGSLAIGAATTLWAVENSPAVLRAFPGDRRGGRLRSAPCRCAAGRRWAATCATPPRPPTWPPSSLPAAPRRPSPTGGPSAACCWRTSSPGRGRRRSGPGSCSRRSRVPRLPPGSFAKYFKSFRSAMDCCTVGVGVVVDFAQPARPCSSDVRLALGAVAPTPIRATAWPRSCCVGQDARRGADRARSAEAAAEARPITDVRASAEYRKTLVEVLSRSGP